MKKTIAQNVALTLAIVNMILVIPATLLIFALIFYGIGIFLLPIYIGGDLLLYGYYQRAAGKLSEGRTIFLWIGTIIFNIVPLILIVWLGLPFFVSNSNQNANDAIWFWNAFGFFVVTVILASVALWDDWQKN